MATDEKPSVDRIVQELLEGSLTRAERIERLRELARREEDVPDELLEAAMHRLMERLTQ